MKTFEIAKYERAATIWMNARADKKTMHFVEMVCEVVDYDIPSDIDAKLGVGASKFFVDGIQVHKTFRVSCKGVNGKWTVLGMFNDDRDTANQLVKEILNHPWYKGWKRVK